MGLLVRPLHLAVRTFLYFVRIAVYVGAVHLAYWLGTKLAGR